MPSTVILAWILQKHMHVFQKHGPSPAPQMTATVIVIPQQTTEHTSKVSCRTNTIKGHCLQQEAKHHIGRLRNQEVSAFSPCRFLWLNTRSKRTKTHVKSTSLPWRRMFLLLHVVLFSSAWNSLLFCDSENSSTICSKMPQRTSTLITLEFTFYCWMGARSIVLIYFLMVEGGGGVAWIFIFLNFFYYWGGKGGGG